MPIIDADNLRNLSRIMCYGDPFTRKTWWALRAAELGYNVIMCDFDHGVHIAKHLPRAALARIFNIDMRTPINASDTNTAFAVLAAALHSGLAYYDDTARVKGTPKTFKPDATYTEFRLRQATPRDVLIIDSWTSLCVQLEAFSSNEIDPFAAGARRVIEQSYYRDTRQLADRFIAGLQRLDCHVIVIGHAIEYAKRKADAGRSATPDVAIDWIKTSIASVTKSHGYQMSKDASDTLLFSVPNSKAGVYISTAPSSSAIAGSRTVEPMNKPWGELGIELFLPPLEEISESFTSKAVRTVTGEEILREAAAAKKDSAVLNAKAVHSFKIGTNK